MRSPCTNFGSGSGYEKICVTTPAGALSEYFSDRTDTLSLLVRRGGPNSPLPLFGWGMLCDETQSSAHSNCSFATSGDEGFPCFLLDVLLHRGCSNENGLNRPSSDQVARS